MWSRRINERDRIVYEVADTGVRFLQARFHYEDR
jgi:Txe/YoeB family toxin of Txe-Axe toxin-antitoxin module